jgi:hypothetical protein
LLLWYIHFHDRILPTHEHEMPFPHSMSSLISSVIYTSHCTVL